MTTVNTTQTAKHVFPPIRIDLLDRLLDEADKRNKNEKVKQTGFFFWQRK